MAKGCLIVVVALALFWIFGFGLLELLAVFSGHFAQLPLALIMMGVPAGITAWYIAHSKRKTALVKAAQDAFEQRNADILHELQTVESLPCDFTSPSGFILRQGEGWYFHISAQAMTPQTTVVQKGGYVGVSIPIGRTGLAINPGSFGASMVPVTSFASAGSGMVYVTNQRVVFVGPHQVADIALGDIVNIEAYKDGVRLDIANRQPWIFVSGDIALSAYVYRAIHG